MTPNFNAIAPFYRWLEYLTLGRTLQRCRLHFLPSLLQQKNALILGDGDGRFTAALLARNPTIQATAIDTSASMLSLLRQRCEAANAATRLETHQANALAFPLKTSGKTYDLIVTHFFLDCLTQPDLESLIDRIAPTFGPGSLWLLSDHTTPLTKAGFTRIAHHHLLAGMLTAELWQSQNM